MDGPHYPASIINSSTPSVASYPAHSDITPNQLLSHASFSSHSLPPLQHSAQAMQSAYGSYPHTPRSATTPNTPGSNNAMANYPPPPPQNAGRGTYQMMPNNPYQQAPQPYTSSALMPQTSTAPAHPQAIAPAPSPGGRVPPVLRPMPAGGVMPQPGLNSPYAQSPLMPQPPVLPEGDQPTHVVGSQGRRGILPSAPGRPAAPAPGTTSAKNQVPQKDADGKFPCPHCTKTYLHAKHLKRHLLRHTGDRPYMCVLCRDTFSRSDILKRHFQKCSIRRGNPQGMSHLSHPQAHVKKNANAQKGGGDGDVNHMNGMGNMPADGMVHPFGLIPTPDGLSSTASDQGQLSRSSSQTGFGDSSRDRSMPGSGLGVPSHGGGYDQSYIADDSNSITANINPQLANYSMPPAQNGIPMFGGANANPQSGLDWSQMFQPGAQDTYAQHTSFPPNAGQTPIALKHEPNAEPSRAGDILAEYPTESHAMFVRDVPPAHYGQLSTQLFHFLCPLKPPTPSAVANMNLFLRPANIKDFLDKYPHFHAHFPILHTPTLRIVDAYIGLVASMCCIDACYSDLVSPAIVREMQGYLSDSLGRHTKIFGSQFTGSGPSAIKAEPDSYSPDYFNIEELQAVMLVDVLLLWHGSPAQRDRALRKYSMTASFTRSAGLLRVPSTDPAVFNPLHQPTFAPRTYDPATFNWSTWIEQEKRIRVMHVIILCDVALGLYFNRSPEFDPFEVQLPLPSDDAAWDAESALECAEALGLHGPEAASERNADGTRRCKQPEMHLALRALLHGSYQIQPGTTNLYGKFILIHAILALIRRAQTDTSATILLGYGNPLPRYNWIIGGKEEPHVSSGHNSAAATPLDHLMAPGTYSAFCVALDKFKVNWDLDMSTQFPPSTDDRPRRYGFCRDGIHFYWLATFLLQNTRLVDLQMPGDQRFMQVIHLLKSVREWVMTDGASRGELAGSVGDIDQKYGVADLTLDMAQLFKPLPQVVDSAKISSTRADFGRTVGGNI